MGQLGGLVKPASDIASFSLAGLAWGTAYLSGLFLTCELPMIEPAFQVAVRLCVLSFTVHIQLRAAEVRNENPLLPSYLGCDSVSSQRLFGTRLTSEALLTNV